MTDPKGPEVSRLFQQALALHRAGELAQAADLYGRVLAGAPEHFASLSNLAVALRDLGRAAEALQSCDRALALRPDHAGTWNNRGVALADLGRREEAVASFDRALAMQPAYPEALNNKGRALAALGQIAGGDDPLAAEALAALNRATALNPGYAEAYDNKGLLLFELGRFGEAAEAVDQAISLEPGNARFYYHLTELRRLGADDPRLVALEALAQAPGLGAGDRILAHFALGSVHDRLGDPAKAFEHWRRGNALRRAQIAYDEAGALAQLESIRRAFPAEAMQAAAESEPARLTPVFVIGLPRSGSTLVEQILASHPDVSAVGETDALRRAVRAVGHDPLQPTPDLTAPALKALGAEYLRIAGARPRAKAVVDKRLDNFLNAGLIRLALPQARLIHVRRDPRDLGLSCFSKLFGEDLAYTFDLGELGRYHRGYEALMAHWREVLPPGAMIEVEYESLVEDLEGQTRRMLDHCGLRSSRRCLDFHLTPRRIPTASATQVRRPLYRESVGRWRRYEPWLGPLIEALSGRD